jgi:hypothetical protein
MADSIRAVTIIAGLIGLGGGARSITVAGMLPKRNAGSNNTGAGENPVDFGLPPYPG